jgi:DNA-binding LytR/AlgR family response regulator
MILAVMALPWLATALAPPDEALARGWRPKARFLAVHGLALLLFSAAHVAGFVLLRHWVYALMGAGPYEFGDRFVYELRKDLLTYGADVAAFWLIGYLRRRRDEPVRPVSFDIRDGARIIRAPLSDIVAVSSAGNYVEFWLADGRRPLMRATLAAVEVELERFGFVRAHRSWLVNAGRVTGLRPDGSGDWTVELGAIEAPVSRRYPHALERLKTPA